MTRKFPRHNVDVDVVPRTGYVNVVPRLSDVARPRHNVVPRRFPLTPLTGAVVPQNVRLRFVHLPVGWVV